MRGYLQRSIASKRAENRMGEFNYNKLHGLLAEVDFRSHLQKLGYGDRVSPGGWIAPCVGNWVFGHRTVVFFPELIQPDREYSKGRSLPNPPHALHTICATLHQIGIASYFCAPTIKVNGKTIDLEWQAIRLGLPSEQQYGSFPTDLAGFSERVHPYNFLRWNTDVGVIPENAVTEEFSKEHIRIAFQNKYLAEVLDMDGILWGDQGTYPLEINEKTAETDRNIGHYFGLDVGSFLRLAYYAAKRGNLHSLFIVREIADVEQRELVAWRVIKFDKLAQFASWKEIGGGRNMQGGRSTVVRIPKSEFSILNEEYLNSL
jgi:hypothetical protein